MRLFAKRHPTASTETRRRLERAQREYEHQRRKHADAMRTRRELEKALAQNHLAQLMFEALSARREAN